MRTVNVYKYHRDEGEVSYRKVPDGKALFHQWGVNYEQIENCAVNFSTAIIERADGKVETPPADMIEFVK